MMRLLHSPRAQTGGKGWVLGNQSNLMNKGMNQIESLSYEIMSLLVCPHSRGKSSYFLLPFIFFWFPFSVSPGFPLFPLRPPLPCSLFSHLGGWFLCGGGRWGGVDRILVSCFSLASKPYNAYKQEARCV